MFLKAETMFPPVFVSIYRIKTKFSISIDIFAVL